MGLRDRGNLSRCVQSGWEEKESLTSLCFASQAYLRIRPAPPGVRLQSYIQVLNDTDVLMVPPAVRYSQMRALKPD